MAFQDASASSTAVDGATVEKFTDGHTRVVWLTDADNKDTFADRNNLQLWGYDSRDGRGERIIWGERGNYYRPLITPDGEHIVYSNRQTRKIFVIKWDGSPPRVLKDPGCAAQVWRDPQTGRTWVYYQENSADFHKPVLRFPMDEPDKVQTVWSSTLVQALPSFQLSRDGKMAASTFPWPNCGVAQLPDVAWRKHRNGCWPSMAPDNSYISWTFDGQHRNLIMTRAGDDDSWTLNVSHAPGVNNFEVYHPRWSNDVRYMVMTGPYTSGDKKVKLWDAADGVEIYIGKFSKDFRKIDGWLKLTDSRIGELFPDVWIAGGELRSSRFSATVPANSKRSLSGNFQDNVWPGSRDGLLFQWRDNKDNGQFIDGAGKSHNVRLSASGGARFGPNGEMQILSGAFVPDGTFNKKIADACRKTNEFAIEVIVNTSRVPQFGPARIVSLSRNPAKRNFTLGQDGDRLVLRLQTSGTNRNGRDFVLAPIAAGKTYHVIVSYKPGLLVCYVNGKIASQTTIERGTFKAWHGDSYSLIFGNEVGRQRPWEGYLDGVAIYSRFVKADEAAAQFGLAEARLHRRPEIKREVVKAQMLQKADAPPPEAIAPYRRALVINRYRIEESKNERLLNQTVEVAEWALLDAQIPPTYSSAKPGQVFELSLEPYKAHPELEGERLVSEMPLDEDPYYNVTSGR